MVIRGYFRCMVCGDIVIRHTNAWKNKTCGCIPKNTKHGETSGGKHTRIYKQWLNMKNRCSNPKNHAYGRYGGRGIVVCEGWKDDFAGFMMWAVNNGYSDSLTIDRINNNKGYSPENCRFVTLEENSRNKSTSKLSMDKAIEIRKLYATGNYTQKDLAKIYGVSFTNIGRVTRNEGWI